jgi:cytosine/adenosine deaminase-related metal-dependent hydrolase
MAPQRPAIRRLGAYIKGRSAPTRAVSREKMAQRYARRERLPIAKARANVARSQAMRSYWTRARSYADKHKISARQAARSKGFKRTEGVIKKSEKGLREGATEREQRAAAEKLMRALQRQGLVIGKGKTWRDYVRKRRR